MTKRTAQKTIHGFKVVHVFDVSQTEGEELPNLPICTAIPANC